MTLHTTRLTVRIAALGLCLLATTPAARAQINPFIGYKGPTLGKADTAASMEAARRLLNDDEPKVGASESWTGAKSGNSGTVTIERIYQKDGRECRDVRSRITFYDGSDRGLLLATCQVSGKWRLM